MELVYQHFCCTLLAKAVTEKPSFQRRGNKPQLSWEDVKEVAPSLIHYSDLGT